MAMYWGWEVDAGASSSSSSSGGGELKGALLVSWTKPTGSTKSTYLFAPPAITTAGTDVGFRPFSSDPDYASISASIAGLGYILEISNSGTVFSSNFVTDFISASQPTSTLAYVNYVEDVSGVIYGFSRRIDHVRGSMALKAIISGNGTTSGETVFSLYALNVGGATGATGAVGPVDLSAYYTKTEQNKITGALEGDSHAYAGVTSDLQYNRSNGFYSYFAVTAQHSATSALLGVSPGPVSNVANIFTARSLTISGSKVLFVNIPSSPSTL